MALGTAQLQGCQRMRAWHPLCTQVGVPASFGSSHHLLSNEAALLRAQKANSKMNDVVHGDTV